MPRWALSDARNRTFADQVWTSSEIVEFVGEIEVNRISLWTIPDPNFQSVSTGGAGGAGGGGGSVAAGGAGQQQQGQQQQGVQVTAQQLQLVLQQIRTNPQLNQVVQKCYQS